MRRKQKKKKKKGNTYTVLVASVVVEAALVVSATVEATAVLTRELNAEEEAGRRCEIAMASVKIAQAVEVERSADIEAEEVAKAMASRRYA